MLNLAIFLFTILGIWTLKFILPRIFIRIRGERLPKGCIIVNKKGPIQKTAPGKKLTQIAVGFGILYSYVILIDLSFHLILGGVELLYLIELPIWVNWIGMIGMWVIGVWVALTFTYNVNYTACTSQIKKENYVLATGGPYSYIRHPAYIAAIFENILIFLATGAWMILFGLIGFLALPYQAKEEEKMLREMFGAVYDDYVAKTGRFFPKVSKCYF